MSLYLSVHSDPALDKLANEAAKAAFTEFADKKLATDQLGIAFGLVQPDGSLKYGAYRGDDLMYPASVVKMFYLGYAGRLLEDKQLKLTTEFERGIHDMIVDSNNDATGLVLDTITGTTGGPELPPKQLEAWKGKRRLVNMWLKTIGIDGINASQKTWNEGPYGRERQGYGKDFEFRNSISPMSCLFFMGMLANDSLVSKSRSEWMKGYLHREIPADSDKADGQSKAYTGGILPKGFKLWSKAGWTDTVRHDVAMVESPKGQKAIVVVFTKGQSTALKIIPFVSKKLLVRLHQG